MINIECPYCITPSCDCLCNTCLRTKIILNLPNHVYEMDDYTRREWINNQLRLLKGEK